MGLILRNNAIIKNLVIGGTGGGGESGGGGGSPSGPSYLVVGGQGLNSYVGSAFVYDSSDYTASPTTLTHTGLSANDRFGGAVSGDSSLVVVGAYNDDNALGAAYAYDVSNLSSAPTKLVATSRSQYSLFGIAVSVSSKHAAVAASYENSRRGAVYVYDANNLSASPTKLQGSSTNAYFGESVIATDNFLIVGAKQDNTSGAVYVYDATNLSASPTRVGAPSGTNEFGSKIAVNNTQLVAAPKGSNNRVFVYDLGNLSGTPTELSVSGTTEFGYAVAASNNYIIISDYRDSTVGSETGAFYVFDASNLSSTPTKVTFPGSGTYSRFGSSVTIVGNEIAVGTNNQDDVYIYDATNLSASPTVIAGGGDTTGRVVHLS
jgi:hypothetical protein